MTTIQLNLNTAKLLKAFPSQNVHEKRNDVNIVCAQFNNSRQGVWEIGVNKKALLRTGRNRTL